MISLSICIPSYNRKGYITEVLDSIISQRNRNVEIVVVDDNSQDGTFQIAKSYIDKYPDYKIRVIKNKKNLGFDGNVLKCVSEGKGKFIWLLGDDDRLLPGSINKVLGEIDKNPEASLIYCNYIRYDNVLKKVTSEAMVNLKGRKIYRDVNQFFFREIPKSYFQYLGTNIITMSTDVINKRLWMKALPYCRKGLGHNFIHCFVVARMLSENPYVVYLGKPLVMYRSKNHRVWPNDIWKDYNKTFIDFLIKNGYDREKSLKMRERQRIFEKREKITKNLVLGYIVHRSPIISKTVTSIQQLFGQ